MDVDHPGTRDDSRLDGLSDGIGDVVKLQIEKDGRPPVRKATNESRSLEREETTAHLDAIDDAMQGGRQFERTGAGFDVESD
jgi:hypothetical protein